MAGLHLTFLGGMGVTKDGSTAVHFGSRKAQALLCYLAANRQGFTREALAGLLWSEMQEANARMNLRRVLYRLRPLLDPYLQISSQEVAFNHDLPYLVDVEQFETAVSLPNRNHTRLQEAVDLYRGDFLDGFTVKKAPAFDEWMLVQRVRLRDLAVQTLQTLVSDCLENEAYHDGISYANRLLALDPWREDAHRQLMTLLARSGQRSAALLQYESCRRILGEELGIDPSPATMALHQQILDNAFETAKLMPPVEPIGGRETAVPPPFTEKPVPHNLQRPLIPFLGRKKELVLLAQLLADPTAQSITILGPGGMGKTRLALGAAEAALASHNGQDAFQHGIYFISLAQLGSADGILPAIAEALNFNFYEYGQPEEQLLSYLRGKQILLILDNFEHITEGAALVEKILRTSPGIKIIVTSREKLNRQWEYLFHLSGMDFPASRLDTTVASKIDSAANFGAVQLFLKTAQRARPSFSPSPADLGHVVYICNLVEGMPLGIILAAGWLEILLPHEIAAGIKQGLDFLETEMGDVPQRQRSLRAAFAYSWRLLTDTERMVFQQLSVFQGGFTYDSVQTVTGATLHDLKALAGKSLLQRDMNGRYQIHELLRQFAAEQLANELDVETAVHDRHSAYFCQAIAEKTPHLKGPRQKSTLDEIEIEFNNALKAWNWAVQQGIIARLDQAAEGLAWFCLWYYRQQDLKRIFREAIDLLQEATTGVEQRLLIRLLFWYSLTVNEGDESHRILQWSLDLVAQAQLAGEDMRFEEALCRQAQAAQADSFAERKRRIEQSIALYQSLADPWYTANALMELGGVAFYTADFTIAAKALEVGRCLAEDLDDPRLIARYLELFVNLSTIIVPPEEISEMEQKARQCMAIRRELGQGYFQPSSMTQVMLVLWAQGKYEQMVEPITTGLAVLEELGAMNTVFQSIYATALAHLGKYEQAYQLAMKQYSGAQNPFVAGYATAGLGCVLLAKGERTVANQWFKQALAYLRQIKARSEEIWYLANWALAERSGQTLKLALKGITEAKAYGIAYSLAPAAAIYFAEQGDVERAVEFYGLAERYPAVANSRWYADVVGQEISALAQSLPPDVVDGARQRGRARDLWATAVALLAELTD